MKKGAGLPDWVENAPDALPGEDLYMAAFADLLTERTHELGPIPFSKILWYACDLMGLDESYGMVFCTVIREMDIEYLNWLSKERETKSKSGAAHSPAMPSTSRVPRARRARRR